MDLVSKKYNPTAEELWDCNIDSRHLIVPFLGHTDGVNFLLNVLKIIPEDNTYFLIGNGMYKNYLIAKGLFFKTSMQEKIVYIPVSRKLAALANNFGVLDKFYDYINIKKFKGNLVIIDHTTQSNGHSNCVLRVAQSIRQYLIKEGEDENSVLGRVIPIGISETSDGGGEYNCTYSVSDFRKFIFSIKTDVGWGGFFPCDTQPYLHGGKEFLTANWYCPIGLSYWAGKYNQVGSHGFPVGNKEDLNLRKILVIKYNDLLQKTKEIIWRDDIRNSISSILKGQSDGN
jgi:hypothetical protein